jgi:6-oxo-cyclohex-1-ene-carbonyl-CoA hydrolase
MTGQDVIDFIKYRQLLAEGREVNDELMEEVLPKPK